MPKTKVMKLGGTMKRILVISNEPFSNNTSNGRTLKNLMNGYDVEKMAQFYLHGVPDMNFCPNNFQVTDRDALHAFLHKRKKAEVPVLKQQGSDAEKVALPRDTPAVRRSCRNLIIRDIVWSTYAWWDKAFEQFLVRFSPEVVLIQGGDAPFLFALAQKIAKRFNASLVQFTTENYVLKRYMYSDAHKERFWHFLFQKRMKRRYASFMKQAAYNIYSTDQLEQDYQQQYPHPGKSAALYTVTELLDLPTVVKPERDYFQIVYCGNMGVGRTPVLTEFAKVLQEIDPRAMLEVYGKCPDETEKKALCAMPNVKYRGLVPYSEVVSILQGADMTIHCENTAWLSDLRTAFSTKIADSLAVGTPFLVYADRQYPFVKYLENNRCAHIAGDREELKQVLTACINDVEYCLQYVATAKETALRNHSEQSCCSSFNRIIDSL